MKTYLIYFKTLGCRLNYSETEIIAGNFKAQGHRIVTKPTEADLCVLNSCTVTSVSDAKCRQHIRSFQRANPNSWTAVIGCYSQMDSQTLSNLGVNLILGNQEKFQLADYFTKFLTTKKQLINVTRISSKPFKIPPQIRLANHTRANLKIQDGCNFVCAFCIIPFARGRARARIFKDLIQEAKTLATYGYKEIILTGVNIGTYNESNHNFLNIIDVLESIDGIQRIRISSIEPTTVSEKIFDYMKDKQSKLLPFLHLPLQSGTDKILSAMRRKYSFQAYRDFLLEAYKKVPDICLGTDIITGFPTETDEDFEETYQNLQKLPLHFFHVFPFSARAGTRAAQFKMVDPLKVKTRALQLRNLSQQKRNTFYKTQIGKIKEVLFETSNENFWFGYTDNYIRVKTKNEKIYKNCLQKVKIKNISNLLAEAVVI